MNHPIRPTAAALLFLVAGLAMLPLVFDELGLIAAMSAFLGLLGAAVAFPKPAKNDRSRLRSTVVLSMIVASSAGFLMGVLLWFDVVGALLPLTLFGGVGFAVAGGLAIADNMWPKKRGVSNGAEAPTVS